MKQIIKSIKEGFSIVNDLYEDSDIVPSIPKTLLQCALALEHKAPHYVEKCIQLGADVNGVKLDQFDPPLLTAIFHNSVHSLVILLRHNARANCLDPDRRFSPLIAAFEVDKIDCADVLLAYGADINFRNDECQSALTWAIMKPDLSMIKYLLKRGAIISDLDRRYAQVCESVVIKDLIESHAMEQLKRRMALGGSEVTRTGIM